MAFLPARARIAPIALFVAFAFVVVGVLRADRAMASAEEDRVTLFISETATLIQVFLLRHILQLQVAERVVGSDSDNPTQAPDSLTIRSGLLNRTHPFDALWLTDSTHEIRGLMDVHGNVVTPSTTVSASILDFPAIDSVVRTSPSYGNYPIVSLGAHENKQLILFVESVQLRRGVILVGAVTVDSLTALLRRQPQTKLFNVTVRASLDTVVAVSASLADRQTRTVEREITTLSGTQWSVAVGYVPTGRAVRIALWVVGLGAILGLGIGLTLERREASRIADRSSELEHLSAELLRANRAKSEFLANVSHELRTPLNAIVGFVDLLRDGVYGALNPRQAGPVERIEASANHLRHLVDQVLDLAKMAAGRLEVHAEPLELRPFVFDVASEVEPLITEKGLSFSLAVSASLPRVRTDPTHLRQILINLLGNAVKFTSNGGVSVRGRLIEPGMSTSTGQLALNGTTLWAQAPRADGLWIVLQVADSGIGIPEKDCERIFDEFEQVNAGPRGDSMRRGTGLGLSISRRLARLLGGDISVESELGRGSIFTVWLPVDPADLRGDRGA